jgi:DNA gyrase subunit B
MTKKPLSPKSAKPTKEVSTDVNTQSYSASDLQVLEGLDAVRKRPGMYIGGTDSRGLTHLAFEIIDNAVDEALAGHCSHVEVVLHKDGSVSVADDGRGIPVDINPQTKLTGVELVFTKLHAGGKFGGSGYKVAGGLHGVGASVVNALSERLEVQVLRSKKLHTMTFSKGRAGVFNKNSFTPSNKLLVSPVPKDLQKGFCPEHRSATGTKVRFWPDKDIFPKEAVLDVELLKERLSTTSYLVPGFSLTLISEIDGSSNTYSSRRGTPDLVAHLAKDPLHAPLHLVGSGSFVEKVPTLTEDGLTPMEVSREVEVDVSLVWTSGFDQTCKSFVNIVSTPKGGTHVNGFERALTKAVQDLCSQGRAMRSSEEPPEKADVLEGLVYVVSVKFPEPQYEGQTKEVLGTPAVAKVVSDVLTSTLKDALAARGGKSISKTIVEKVVSSARTRRTLRTQRDVLRRKSALESSALPAKLVDCRSEDNSRTEILIVEGDSAMGTAKSARDSDFQALLPIRGKILNTLRASEQKMLENQECAAIVAALGAGAGRTFDLDSVRYGKLIILADADVDGAHIRCLLLAMTWRYMRPLLESGRIYAAQPPLHRITLARSGEIIYTYSDQELRSTLERIEKKGGSVKEVQRYKGLGEMDADQLFETTLDPARRVLRQITVEDAAKASEVFELLMGDEVAPRRDFIVEASEGFDRSWLDI